MTFTHVEDEREIDDEYRRTHNIDENAPIIASRDFVIGMVLFHYCRFYEADLTDFMSIISFIPFEEIEERPQHYIEMFAAIVTERQMVDMFQELGIPFEYPEPETETGESDFRPDLFAGEPQGEQ